MSREIPLTQGKVAIVDDEDYEVLSQFKWHAWKSPGGHWYAKRKMQVNGRPASVSLQNFLMKPSDGLLVDHVNHNGLDNRRTNLRPCTSQQNKWNNRAYSTNKSGLKGVMWVSSRARWHAVISSNGQRHRLGTFMTAEEAARAYDAAARIHHGQFACLNFPAVLS